MEESLTSIICQGGGREGWREGREEGAERKEEKSKMGKK